jgi:RNA polymerase sigma-70 factor (ECF subfamily)
MAGESDQGGEPARLREGDPAAWESFYERVYPMMLAYSQRRLGYNEEARDAVSEALARTVTTVARMAELDTSPEAWSFGILRNVVIDLQRHVNDTVASADPSEVLDSSGEHENVRRAFAQLNDVERELLELRVIAGLSSEQVATVLAMSPGAVRMAQARALTKLRNLMPEEVQP